MRHCPAVHPGKQTEGSTPALRGGVRERGRGARRLQAHAARRRGQRGVADAEPRGGGGAALIEAQGGVRGG